MVMMIVIMKILIITNLIQRMMIVVLAMMKSRSNNSLLPILMILILNQMMNIPIRTLDPMILGYYYGFLSIRQDFIFRNSLIKFFRFVLSDADNERFKNFPISFYMMRKV